MHPDYPNGVALQRNYPNLVVTRTFSKIHGLAALRIGYAVSSAAIADLLNRVRQPFNVSSVGLECAEAALADRDFVELSRRLNDEGMAQLRQGLDQLGVGYIPSGGNFLAIDLGRPARASTRRSCATVSSCARSPATESRTHLRITVGLHEENARFLDALARVL